MGRRAALAVASLAGMLDDLAGAVALRTGGLGLHATQNGVLPAGDHAGAAAFGAGDGGRAIGRAGAAAVLARRQPIIGNGAV